MPTASDLSGSSFSLTDAEGHERAKLGLSSGVPSLVFYDAVHNPRLQLGLTADGLPQVLLHGLSADLPTVKLECDAVGNHLLLNGANRSQTYLFLKSEGGSGLVLFGPSGQRQIEVLLTADGIPRWTLWDKAGNVMVSSQAKPPPPTPTESS